MTVADSGEPVDLALLVQCVQKFWSDYQNLVIFGDFQIHFPRKCPPGIEIFKIALLGPLFLGNFKNLKFILKISKK